MTSLSSMQYTIGTALDRAKQGNLYVELLVGDHWLEGLVAAADGQGVVLDNEGRDHCVVRLERISAVRVGAEAPRMNNAPTGDPRMGDPRIADGASVSAMPMPGPRAAAS
jgi:hypothetical protein